MEVTEAIAGTRRTRQYRTTAEKRFVVEETLVAGVSVATVARAHGVNANQVFAWRKLYQAGLLGRSSATLVDEAGASSVLLLPVTVAEDAERRQTVTIAASKQGGIDPEGIASPGSIELSLAKAQVHIAGHVDADALRVVLKCLLG